MGGRGHIARVDGLANLQDFISISIRTGSTTERRSLPLIVYLVVCIRK
jgi:hypothetical protein